MSTAEPPPRPPRVSVVLPSFNQGRYLDDCLRSLLGQGYPDLEVLVYDGGSTDDSVDVIRRHAPALAYWQSQPDGGQAAAINAGFQRSTGDILGWLNSDDMHLPGTLAYAAANLDATRPEVLFGNCLHIVEGEPDSAGSDVVQRHAEGQLALHDYIVQPSAFWTRAAWERTGELDAALHFGFDWDWFIRAQRAGVRFTPHVRYLAVYRAHPAHKTGVGGERRWLEMAQVYERHAGPRHAGMYLQGARRREEVLRLRKWIHRLRLAGVEPALMKLRFPGIFRGHRDADIREVLRMI